MIIGMILAAAINAGLRGMVYSLVDNYGPYTLSISSIWIGVCLGIFMPILSNILPIKRALGKNLRSSLDVYHRANTE